MAGAHRSPRRAQVRWDRAAALSVAVAVTGFAVVTGAQEVVAPSDGAPTARGRVVTSYAQAPGSAASGSGAGPAGSVAAAGSTAPVDAADLTLPAGSGAGRRVVFDQSRQRVWLVGKGQRVRATYLVSGSVTDNLHPGHYAVYSRSDRAVGVDDSGTMRWFVRFTRGQNAAIGFHDIPVDNGRHVQTIAQLGTPLSHGCIRQKESDAKAMWRFADLGTKVDVVA